MRLSGKIALVTGGASGMGAATAARFAREGAGVAIVDRDATGVHAVAAGLDGVLPIVADVGTSAEVNAAFASAVERLGPIDVVVHAAGIDDTQTKAAAAAAASRGEPLNVTAEMTDEQWRDHLRVNLDGTFYVVRAALQGMLPRGAGSIVAVSSIGGITGCFMVNYSAAKGGVLAFVRAVAQEVWSRGIRVNAIAPGLIDTPMMRRNPLITAPPANVGRWGSADEVASTALFLASDESSFVTGETIIVCGGLLTI
jgi:NAD(P)-dependent dehydrogenase (short-subunit alcohol dehydrogenase family)